MNRLGRLRAAWGTLQVLAPGLIAARFAGRPPDRRERRVIRVLGVRQLVQAVGSGRAPTYPMLALGVEIDCLHGASMVGLGLVDRARRRLALVDAVVASTFALSGLVAARASLRSRRSSGRPTGIAGLRDRGADRLARHLVPGPRPASGGRP